MLRAERRIVLDYLVNPSMVCGGVWVNEQGRFVAVTPDKPYYDDVTGTTLWEYNDTNDEGRACLLSVPAGCASRAWEITGLAKIAHYQERERTVAGQGTLDRWTKGGDNQTQTYESFDPPDSTEPVTIQPGDSFRVRASRELGVHVLATFSDAPFKNEYETRVSPPAVE